MAGFIQVCPVCGRRYQVSGPEEKVRFCEDCQSKRIARAGLQPVSGEEGGDSSAFAGEPGRPDGAALAEKAREQTVGGWDDLDALEEVGSPFDSAPSEREKEETEKAPENTVAKGEIRLCPVGAEHFDPVHLDPKDSPLILGREATCGDLLDADVRVSRIHCALTYSQDGWMVEDRKSANGTYLDGKAVSGEKTPLWRGSVLRLGNMPDSFSFRIEEEG